MLATPPKSGFDLVAWIVPPGGGAAGWWRSRSRPAPGRAGARCRLAPRPISDDEARRVQEELAAPREPSELAVGAAGLGAAAGAHGVGGAVVGGRDGPQLMVPLPPAVSVVSSAGVPSVMVTALPLITIVRGRRRSCRSRSAPRGPAGSPGSRRGRGRPRRRAAAPELALLRMVSASPPRPRRPPPSAIATTMLVDAPVQPARMDCGLHRLAEGERDRVARLRPCRRCRRRCWPSGCPTPSARCCPRSRCSVFWVPTLPPRRST